MNIILWRRIKDVPSWQHTEQNRPIGIYCMYTKNTEKSQFQPSPCNIVNNSTFNLKNTKRKKTATGIVSFELDFFSSSVFSWLIFMFRAVADNLLSWPSFPYYTLLLLYTQYTWILAISAITLYKHSSHKFINRICAFKKWLRSCLLSFRIPIFYSRIFICPL